MKKLLPEDVKIGLPVFFFVDPKDNVPNVKTEIIYDTVPSKDGPYILVKGIDIAMPINHFKISSTNESNIN